MKICLQYINEASVVSAIFICIVIIIYEIKNGRKLRLEDILVRGVMAASAIPTGFALLLCAFDPLLLQSMTGFNIHIATAGIALLFISCKTIVNNPLTTDVRDISKTESIRGTSANPTANRT